MTIEKRMDKLERQNRRLKQVVALIAILGVSGALMGAKHVPKQIVARSILIKGKSGRTVRLTETGLEIRDAKGNMRGAFYGGLIYLYRKGGKEGLRLNREGFRLLGKKGIVRVVVSERGMSLYDGIRGKLRLRANVNAKGNPLVSLFDGNQRTRTKLGVATPQPLRQASAAQSPAECLSKRGRRPPGERREEKKHIGVGRWIYGRNPNQKK